jgi:hypothetical protein
MLSTNCLTFLESWPATRGAFFEGALSFVWLPSRHVLMGEGVRVEAWFEP